MNTSHADAMAAEVSLHAQPFTCTECCGKPYSRRWIGRCSLGTRPIRSRRLKIEKGEMRLDADETAGGAPSTLSMGCSKSRRAQSEPKLGWGDGYETSRGRSVKSNVHPKTVQERLGHEDITTTLNEAAKRVDEALRKALEKQRNAKGLAKR